MDEIVISGHAAEEMAADNITEDDVYAVLGDYDDVLEYAGGRTEYGRTLEDGRYLAVVLEDDGETVVTVWVDARRSRHRGRRR